MHFAKKIPRHVHIMADDATKPMQNPATAPWNLSITDADFKKLQAGFKPQQMEDRWVISAADPDQAGNLSIRLSRSWTGHDYYVLVLAAKSDGKSVEIKTITWEQNQGEEISEEEGKE